MVHNWLISNTHGTICLNKTCSRYSIASLQASSTKTEEPCRSFHSGSFVYANLLRTYCYFLCSPCVLRTIRKRNNRPRILVPLLLFPEYQNAVLPRLLNFGRFPNPYSYSNPLHLFHKSWTCYRSLSQKKQEMEKAKDTCNTWHVH